MNARIVMFVVASAAALTLATGPAALPQTSAPSATPIFHDDFSKPSKAWKPGIHVKYVDGSLHFISPSSPDTSKEGWVETRKIGSHAFPSVRIEVDVRKIAGPDHNNMSITCGPDNDHLYFLVILGDGRYGFAKDTSQGLVALKLGSTRAVRRGTAVNHLSGTCTDGPVGTPATLSLSVNGKRVGSVTDPDSLGRVRNVGLHVASREPSQRVEAAFDNLFVYPASPVLFQDDFSNASPPKKGWGPGTFSYGTIAYVNGSLHLGTVSDPDLTNESIEDYLDLELGPLSSLRIEVDATKISGPDHNNVNVECGSDSDHIYTLVTLQDGRYGFTKTTYSNGKQSDFKLLKLEATSAVHPGGAVNHISGTCKAGPAGTATTLSLSVNGQLVDTVTDPSGFGPLTLIGLSVASRDPSAPLEVAYDNFFVYPS